MQQIVWPAKPKTFIILDLQKKKSADPEVYSDPLSSAKISLSYFILKYSVCILKDEDSEKQYYSYTKKLAVIHSLFLRQVSH